MTIAKNIQAIRAHIPTHVKLVCVSKFHSIPCIQEAYDAGERIFGESRVQELREKQAQLPADIQWHFIGHLQRNKIKYIVPFVTLIHGVDSYQLLSEINNEAAKIGKVVNCLLQIHIAQEETKFGFSPAELTDMLQQNEWRKLQYVRIVGLMGMATFTDNETQIATEFATLKKLFDQAKTTFFSDSPYFSEISMGMSDDYPLAIANGSTIVRIGTAIFGTRT